MKEQSRSKAVAADKENAARGGDSGREAAGETVGPLAPGQRWSAMRKREVVLRLLRGEALTALSRELGIELYRLEEWREKAFTGIDASLRERGGDPVKVELDAALKRLGELTMENELLRMKADLTGPLAKRRSRR